MQTIGLIGGMSWESSLVYYRDLNLGVQARLGGLSSPKVVLSTVDFAELTDLEEHERWDQIGELLAEAARGVERAGADFLLLCTTTFHKVADQVEAAVDIPLLHLGDVVAEACVEQGMACVGLIGTTVAM
uniref:aspartate/glutamate racemase family protein n=1 Tax=Nocardioides sp. TaxID=35761 RepID=UPI00286D9282